MIIILSESVVEIKKKDKELENLESSKAEIGWGHQIRSYVLQPYRLVKDNRTNFESTSPDKVLDGEIDEFFPDTDGDDMGYVTAPWWSPELETNVALGWVPWTSSEIGTKLQVRLPDEYSESSGVAVEGEIVDVPFRESVNPNKREVQKEKGLDYAD